MNRRSARAVAVASLLLAGCVSVGVGTADSPGITYYVLEDARPAGEKSAAAAKETLAVQSLGADPLTDSTSMLYSQRAGERGVYQLAAWTERPTRRLPQLALQRLQARGAFAAVTQLGQPVATDWLLTLTVEQMFHDVTRTPGAAQLVVRAELIDRRQRAPSASTVFSAAPAVAQANAAAAATAFSEAAAEVIDRLAVWVEDSVRKSRSR